MPGWLESLFQKVFVDLVWDSIIFWRVTALTSLGVLAISWHWRDRLRDLIWPEQIHQHDREKFKEVDDLLPEPFIENVLEHLGGAARIHKDGLARLERTQEFLGREENQFLQENLRNAAQELRDAITKLLRLIAHRFYPQPRGSDTYMLEPELNVDTASRVQRAIEEDDKWDRYFEELRDVVDEIDDAYREFRTAVKKHLRT